MIILLIDGTQIRRGLRMANWGKNRKIEGKILQKRQQIAELYKHQSFKKN